MKLRYSTNARLQLSAIYEYLKERSTAGAAHVYDSITTSAERLVRSPHLGVKTDEGSVRLLIEPEYLYRIFYDIRGNEIFVIRILHRSQDW